MHDVLAAHLSPEGCFVHDDPEFERVVVAKDILALHAYFDATFDLVAARPGQHSPNHGPRVVLGLQQPGNEQGP